MEGETSKYVPKKDDRLVVYHSLAVQTTAPSAYMAYKRFCNYQIRRPIKSYHKPVAKATSDEPVVAPGTIQHRISGDSRGPVACAKTVVPPDKPAEHNIRNEPIISSSVALSRSTVGHKEQADSSIGNQPKIDAPTSISRQDKDDKARCMVVKPQQNSAVCTGVDSEGGGNVSEELATVSQPKVESLPLAQCQPSQTEKNVQAPKPVPRTKEDPLPTEENVQTAKPAPRTKEDPSLTEGNVQAVKPVPRTKEDPSLTEENVQAVKPVPRTKEDPSPTEGNVQAVKPVPRTKEETFSAELTARLERLIPENVRAKHSRQQVAKKHTHSLRRQRAHNKQSPSPGPSKAGDEKAPETRQVAPSSSQIGETKPAESLLSEPSPNGVSVHATCGSPSASRLLKDFSPTPSTSKHMTLPTGPKSVSDTKNVSRPEPKGTPEPDARPGFVSPPTLGQTGAVSSVYIDVASEDPHPLPDITVSSDAISEHTTTDAIHLVEKATTSNVPEIPSNTSQEPGIGESNTCDLSAPVHCDTPPRYPNILRAISDRTNISHNRDPIERPVSVQVVHPLERPTSVQMVHPLERPASVLVVNPTERPSSVQVVHQRTNRVTASGSRPTERHSSRKSAEEDDLTVLNGDDVMLVPDNDVMLVREHQVSMLDTEDLSVVVESEVTEVLHTYSLAGTGTNRQSAKSRPRPIAHSTRSWAQELTPGLGSNTPPRPLNRDANPIPEDNIYPCDHCDEIFYSAISYNIHQPVHSTVASTFKHYCCVCTKGFNSKFNHTEHENRCKGVCFDCSECSRKFYHKERLRAHMEAAHQLFICRECERRFRHNSRLMQHEQDEHKLYQVHD